MKPSKLRLKRRDNQRRADRFMKLLEEAALNLAHAIWYPQNYTNAPTVARDRRLVLRDAAFDFVSAVDGEIVPQVDKVVPIARSK